MSCPCHNGLPRVRPAQPTGHREPLFSAEDVARFSPREHEAAQRYEVETVRELAHHEGAHAIAALATGWGLQHVTTESGDPHALLPERPVCGHVPALPRVLISYVAGEIGESIARRRFRRPSPEE